MDDAFAFAVNPMAALGTGASLGEAYLGYRGQKKANKSNERIAREDRAFQERMVNQAQKFELEQSNSAYQRAMDDMRKAGLNPMLAYQQGGASTPIGKTAPGRGAVMLNEMGGMQGSPMAGFSTASSIMSDAAQRERINSQIQNDEAYQNLTEEQQRRVKAVIPEIEARIKNIKQDTLLKGRQASKAYSEQTGIEADNVQRDITARFLKSAEFAAIAKYVGVTAGTLGGIVRFFMRSGRR